MYHYTDEQLESMKKVEASRASRIDGGGKGCCFGGIPPRLYHHCV